MHLYCLYNPEIPEVESRHLIEPRSCRTFPVTPARGAGYTLRHNTMRGTQLPLSTLPNHTWEKGNDVVLPDTDSGLSLLFAYADSARSLRTPPGLISPGRRTADFLSCRTYYSNLLERNFSSAGLACTLSSPFCFEKEVDIVLDTRSAHRSLFHLV